MLIGEPGLLLEEIWYFMLFYFVFNHVYFFDLVYI